MTTVADRKRLDEIHAKWGQITTPDLDSIAHDLNELRRDLCDLARILREVR